jgi:2-polyprenyl-3-methyl-5-hydroxy-6-metoxy-1,4-benzoquinol methylase
MLNLLNSIISKFVEILVKQDFIQNKIKDKYSKKIIDLYSTTEYTRNFVKFRFWFGPLHEINKLVAQKGIILDLGSGEGILANFLAINSSKRKIIGIEINSNRVKEANKKIKNIKFINKSIFEVKLPKVDVIVVSHVFHHLGSKKLQEEMIQICFDKLKNEGKLIVAEVDREFSVRYLFGYITDIMLVPIFFEKKFLDLKIYHRGRNEWQRLFIKYGFVVKSTKITKDRIYPEVIFELTKK